MIDGFKRLDERESRHFQIMHVNKRDELQRVIRTWLDKRVEPAKVERKFKVVG